MIHYTLGGLYVLIRNSERTREDNEQFNCLQPNQLYGWHVCLKFEVTLSYFLYIHTYICKLNPSEPNNNN